MNISKTCVFFIIFCGLASWCFAQAQNDFPYVAEVILDKVNVRAGQNENFEKLGKLSRGEKVVVVDRSYAWDKIKLPANCAAYVSESFLQNLGDGLALSRADRVNIRAGRGTTFSVIGSLKKGTMVRILDHKDGWCRIEPIEGSFGWIQTTYLKFVSKTVPPARGIEAPGRDDQAATSAFRKEGQTPGTVDETAPAHMPQPPKR